MERQNSAFEYLCRVCAANTKGKNTVAECVYILKTPALKDKIEKYLYLTISEDDILPKVLCKACFRQVEATASLSKIAKHTQKVFRDFIFSTKLRSDSINSNIDNNDSCATVTCQADTNTATQPQIQQKAKSPVDNAESTPPPSLPSSACSHKDDVVVNVSLTDPLTRDTQQRIANTSQWRAHSVDSRFTPKSIAQRSFTTSTPKQQEQPNIAAKKQSPPGVINFLHGNPQQQVTTITSGGYVIGCVAKSNSVTNIKTPESSADILNQKRKNLKTALNNIKASNSGQVSLLKVSQKPTKPPTTEVVTAQNTQTQPVVQLEVQPQPQPLLQTQSSLQPQTLPQSHQQSQTQSQLSKIKTNPKLQLHTNPTVLLTTEDGAPAEALPEKMIIAATKQRKTSTTSHLSSETEPEPTDLSQTSKSSLPDEILLGKVIKDLDLLKLILKALKWPVTKQTMDSQILRLRNSRFAQIMSDPNLLQDPDLTQIMGPYLGPVLQAAQMLQQQQQIAAAAAAAAATKAVDFQVAGITNSMPYKLPAETSVQLVPASPENNVPARHCSSQQSMKRDTNERGRSHKHKPRKLRRVAMRARSSSVFIPDNYEGDTVGDSSSTNHNSKSTPNFRVNIDPSVLFSQLALMNNNDTTSSNDALLALLQRQKNALSRQHRSRSNSIITVPANGSDLAFEEDDIILMEPDQNIAIASRPTENSEPSQPSSSPSSLSAASSAFPVPQQISKPLITRPIIKRRKTVIQASPGCTNLALRVNQETKMSTLASTALKVSSAPSLTMASAEKPTKVITAVNHHAVGTQYPSAIISIGTQIPSNKNSEDKIPESVITKATETVETTTISASTSITSIESTKTRNVSPVRTQSKRLLGNKSALGQQLLEAIGLQKIQDDGNFGNNNSVAAKELNVRSSVHQIRSALKKSLQKAQEQQQQRKQGEPIEQIDLDDNSVSIVKEVVVEPKQKVNKSEGDGQLDVEEEINKITLVLQNKVKEDKKSEEVDKKITAASASRIPGIRRKIVPASRSRKSLTNLAILEKEVCRAIEENSLNRKEKGAANANNGKGLSATKRDREESDGAYITASSATSLPNKIQNVNDKDGHVRKRARNQKTDEHKDEPESKTNKDDKEKEKDEQVRAATTRNRPTSIARKVIHDRDYEDDTDASSGKAEHGSTSTVVHPTRPTRASKAMSRYYKGPDARPPPRNTSISTRSTKNRH